MASSPETIPSWQSAWCTCRRKKAGTLRKDNRGVGAGEAVMNTELPVKTKVRVSGSIPALIKLTGLVRNDDRGECGSAWCENVTNQQMSRTFQCSGPGMPTSDGRHATQTSYTLPCVRHTNQPVSLIGAVGRERVNQSVAVFNTHL